MSVDTETVAAATPAPPAKKRKPQLSEGARAERRLGWLLCAPAVIVMVAVTAYPIGYSIYLSLQRYDLRFPDQAEVHRARATTSPCSPRRTGGTPSGTP